MNKKGSGFGFLKAAALAFIVVTIIMAIGADITSGVRSSQCEGSNLDVNSTFFYNTTSQRCLNQSAHAGAITGNHHQVYPAAWNTSTTGLQAQSDLADNLTTIATVVGAVILLGFLGVKLFGKK